MTNEERAASVESKLALSRAWADFERLRLIDDEFEDNLGELNETILCIARDKKELKAARFENFKLLLAVSDQIDELQGEPAVAATVAAVLASEEPKKTRSKKTPPPQGETLAPTERHPCHLCEDVFFHKVDLVKHLRISHGLSMEESVRPRSLCADCVSPIGDCVTSGPAFDPTASKNVCGRFKVKLDGFQASQRSAICPEWQECEFKVKCFGPANEEGDTDCLSDREKRRPVTSPPDIGERKAQLIAEKAGRDSKCDKWLDCEHATACFDPAKVELQGTYCMPATKPCWNVSCAWSDLAQADHCEADEQFRAGRPVAECKCFINGIGPTKGQDAAACFNTGCPSNDPELPTCCGEWEEVWECPRVVTAGWGAAPEEEEVSAEPATSQRDAIIRAAIAAGDDINEFGAFLHSEKVEIPMPKGCGHSANISIATASDSSLYISANHQYIDGGSGGPPRITGPNFQTRHAAILAGVAEIHKAWSSTPKSTKRTKALAALDDFAAKDHAPNSSTPTASKEVAKQEEPAKCANKRCASNVPTRDGCGLGVDDRFGKPVEKCSDFKPSNLANSSTPDTAKEEPKQEVAQPVDESTAQASEVVRCRNNGCVYFDSFLPDNCSGLALGEPEPVTACKNYRAEFGLKEAAPQQHVPDDCDNCGNRGIIEGTDDYCNCPHGVRARKGDQAELERRKLRREALNATAQTQTETESGETGEAETVLAGALEPVTRSARISIDYSPLDGPFNNCELCHGFGVIDGELYGEFHLIPCACEAGDRVKLNTAGIDTRRECCKACPADDPDCSNCELPNLEDAEKQPECKHYWREVNPADMSEYCKDCGVVTREAPVKCFNSNCTAVGADAKDKCLDPIKGCKNFKPEAPEPAKAELTPLQLRCTHPKPFRDMMEVGEVCKVCKLNLTQPSLFSVLTYARGET